MSYSTEKLNKQYTVCGNHFEDNQFMNPAMKNGLIHNAVPTIFDIPNPPPKLIRIHHALKMSNMNNSENNSGKLNRKMLKLSHC